MGHAAAIVGPTASGKTALAVRVAETLDGEIVSVDSRQVYRGMDIGTGKDLGLHPETVSELRVRMEGEEFRLPAYRIGASVIWMCDVVEPDHSFNAAIYRTLALAVMDDIVSRGKLPVLAGGTGLYLNVLSGAGLPQVPPDAGLRKALNARPLAELQRMLREENPRMWESMNNSDRQNPRRLIRKIELARAPVPQSVTESRTQWTIHPYGLSVPMDELYRRIDARVDGRMRDGMLEEIETLIRRGYSFALPSMLAMGYGEWRTFFGSQPRVRDEKMKSDAVQRWKFDEHGYARRQMTWFRKRTDIRWFGYDHPGLADNVVSAIRSWYTAFRQ